MRFIQLILLLVISLSTTWSFISPKWKPLARLRSDDGPYHQPKFHALAPIVKDLIDVKTAMEKSKALRTFTEMPVDLPGEEYFPNNIDEKKRYIKDPVLNILRRDGASSDDSVSSSVELKNWKAEWREEWIKKKIEALNMTTPKGDVVDMVAARPWGKPCGDPNQHDMPWGSCTLSAECEAEYRIYRGDFFCGRTQFVCCALQLHTYDMYNALDNSFADSEFETESEETRGNYKGSKEKKRRKKKREKKRRKLNRKRRKRKIKRNIEKIVKQIKKLLNRSYRNGTNERQKKTKELKKFITHLKKKYKKDRESVKDLHETELLKIDSALQKRINQIQQVNENFLSNATYRDLIVNGTIKAKAGRVLLKEHPELSDVLDGTRRRGARNDNSEEPIQLEYDLEYGFAYY